MAREPETVRTARVALLVACGVLVVAILASCGGAGSNNMSAGTGSGSSGTSGSGSGNSGTGGSGSGGSGGTGGGSGGSGGGGGIAQVQHVVIAVLENLDYADVVGSSSAPYINSLIAQGGLATQYYANVHPSIGNYFVMTTGEAYSTDDNFDGVVPIDNVIRELTALSKSWKVYAQSLPSQGYLGGDVYPYLRRHNPVFPTSRTCSRLRSST